MGSSPGCQVFLWPTWVWTWHSTCNNPHFLKGSMPATYTPSAMMIGILCDLLWCKVCPLVGVCQVRYTDPGPFPCYLTLVQSTAPRCPIILVSLGSDGKQRESGHIPRIRLMLPSFDRWETLVTAGVHRSEMVITVLSPSIDSTCAK
jgi:hypothetical protein